MRYHSPLFSRAASIASIQSGDTVRAGPSTLVTSAERPELEDHRWSEVVPPSNGLTFAVVWDPDSNDTLTFSSPELAESEDTLSPDSPSDAFDNRSQVLTIGTSTGLSLGGAATPATLAYFREQNADFTGSGFFPRSGKDRPTQGRTQTSSTLDGLDVYLRGSLLGRAHNTNRYASCFHDWDEADAEFEFDPRTPFAREHVRTWMRAIKGREREKQVVSDEGFFEGEMYEDVDEDWLPSRFSRTTTSTSNFVTVENEMSDAASSNWSTLEAPNTPSYSRLLFTAPAPTAANHRLRKSRRVPPPASPDDVLRRPVPEYNHGSSHNMPMPRAVSAANSPMSSPSRSQTPSPASLAPRTRNLSSVRSLPSLPKLRLGKFKRTASSDSAGASASAGATGPGWVWIDVKDSPGKQDPSPLSSSPTSTFA